MKLTLQIKLLPTDEQAITLKNTFSVFNEACNTISQIAWERHVFKQFSLHKEVYYPIKETYRLSSQLVVRAISKVADAYKLDRKKQRHFREFGAITYDSRVLSYNTENPSVPFRLLVVVRR
jgi:putative transposase